MKKALFILPLIVFFLLGSLLLPAHYANAQGTTSTPTVTATPTKTPSGGNIRLHCEGLSSTTVTCPPDGQVLDSGFMTGEFPYEDTGMTVECVTDAGGASTCGDYHIYVRYLLYNADWVKPPGPMWWTQNYYQILVGTGGSSPIYSSITDCGLGNSGYCSGVFDFTIDPKAEPAYIHGGVTDLNSVTSRSSYGRIIVSLYPLNDLQNDCGQYYDTGTVIAQGTIPANSEPGVLSTLVPGQLYRLHLNGGPWYSDAGGSERYDGAYSYDASTWKPLSQVLLDQPGESCYIDETLTGGGITTYFSALGDAYHLRVNDLTGQFADNTGSLNYMITTAGHSSDLVNDMVIRDGDMEQWPDSQFWFPTKSLATDLFGRLVNSDWKRVFNGITDCGDGFQAVGPMALMGEAAPIEQYFNWPGGEFYWHAMIRANHSFMRTMNDSYATIKVMDEGGDIYTLMDNQLIPVDYWHWYNGSIYLNPGIYRIRLQKGDSAIETDTLYYDEIQAATYPLANVCTQDIVGTPTPGTGTPGPGTGTPTMSTPAVITGTETTTPTPTGTITPSPTLPPLPTPAKIGLVNCDFESGLTGWTWNYNSTVLEPGGPVGSKYGAARSSPPDIRQNFYFPGGYPYIIFSSKGYFQLKFITVATNREQFNLSGYNFDWFQHKFIAYYMPAGNYWLEFDKTSGSPSGGADNNTGFDGVSIGANDWNYNYCALQPTPGPTQTGHPSGTSTPRTGTPGTPTPWGTSYPSMTPWPTGSRTPGPTYNPTSILPWLTPGTGTPWPSATGGTPIPTRTGTITPGTPEGTITPNGTPGTTPVPGIGPIMPPDQPPGGYGALCEKPSNPLDLGWWIDYAVCEIKAFVSWGDPNTDTVKGWEDPFTNKEPFGLIKEIQDGGAAFNGVVNAYDWKSAGLPGQNDAPNTDMITNLPASSPYFGGHININIKGNGSNYSTTCQLKLEPVIGSIMRASVCFIFDILYQTRLMPWFQFFINANCIVLIVFEIWHKWVDKTGD